MTNAKDVTLAVLAGGRGSRMGGPKDRLRIGGVPICEYLSDRLCWPGPTMLVLAESGDLPPGGESFGTIVRDEGAGSGPLRAVATAVDQLVTDVVVALPIDMPCVGPDELMWLADTLAAGDGAGIILFRDGSRQVEPFPCAFRRAASKILRARLNQGLLAMRGLAAEPAVRTMAAPPTWPESVWTNLNSPGDLPDWVTLDSSR